MALASCCAVTSGWAVVTTSGSVTAFNDPLGLCDVARIICWYSYLLFLYFKSGSAPRWQLVLFVLFGLLTAGGSAANTFMATDHLGYSLFSTSTLLRLIICVAELLVIENLYLNLPDHVRWHVAIPCVLLGGIACVDILISAEAALFHQPSQSLVGARFIVMTFFAPFLITAGFRGQRWTEQVKLSRTAAFHSATLVLSGSVLIVLAVVGETLRRFNDHAGWIIELGLIFSGFLGVLLLLSSTSARSMIQNTVNRHFFADRYDYRIQWLQCIGTLSGTGSNEKTSLAIRGVRTIADILNSPNGCLYMLDHDERTLSWEGSWNMPVMSRIDSVSIEFWRCIKNCSIINLRDNLAQCDREILAKLGPTWLAIPLPHNEGIVGLVIVGPPRVPFRLDQEVYDLIKIVGQEVATYISEQKAAEVILETRALHNYGKKFAFVAHDIKNVSSQLGLLLKNAERHLQNPEFQRDMLDTIGASVQKIDFLLRRLDHRSDDAEINFVEPSTRMAELLRNNERWKTVELKLQRDRAVGAVAMSQDVFDAAVTHLINNAVEAGPDDAIVITLRNEFGKILIDIVDRGRGMSPEFIRDHLFTPFRTSKSVGSGIGAYQARELLREAGGQLEVTSEVGIGTAMRVILTECQRPKSNTTDLMISETSRGPRG